MHQAGTLSNKLISVAGGQLPATLTGDSGPAVLCIHGWGLNAAVWSHQHEGLSTACRVISYDRRGFGTSSAPAALSQEPEDLRAILDQLGISSAWIIGQSQGARVAIAFALAFPGRVSGLILQGAPAIDTIPGERAEDEIPVAQYRALAQAGGMDKVRQLWLGHPLLHTSNPKLQANLRAMVSDWPGHDLTTPDPGLNYPVELLATLHCPTLIITGETEPEPRQQAARILTDSLPIARFVQIPDAGHICNAENPAAFNEAILRFVECQG